MNRLTLKALLLSIITELKFGEPLTRNSGQAKKEFKRLVGLPVRATNKEVLKELQRTYEENKLADDFNRLVLNLGAQKFLL
jgi:hypothetical protein